MSSDKTKHVVKVYENLESIARKYYGDPTRWCDIARANGIENPRLIKPGTTLTIPPLDDEDEEDKG